MRLEIFDPRIGDGATTVSRVGRDFFTLESRILLIRVDGLSAMAESSVLSKVLSLLRSDGICVCVGWLRRRKKRIDVIEKTLDMRSLRTGVYFAIGEATSEVEERIVNGMLDTSSFEPWHIAGFTRDSQDTISEMAFSTGNDETDSMLGAWRCWDYLMYCNYDMGGWELYSRDSAKFDDLISLVKSHLESTAAAEPKREWWARSVFNWISRRRPSTGSR
jgi:hypothetical protein